MFAKRLKEIRTDKGYSQPALAKLLNVNRQNISDWENGRSETSFDIVIKLSEIFEVTVGQLFGTEDY